MADDNDLPADRIERARLRRRIAVEAIELCRRITAGKWRRTAVDLHRAHALHSRELGRGDLAELAEARAERELARRGKSAKDC